MKKILIALSLAFACNLGYGQIQDTIFWFKLDRIQGAPREFVAVAQPLRSLMSQSTQRKTSGIEDSIIQYMNQFEKAIATGQAGDVLDPKTVKAAKQQYPGNSMTAIRQRLLFYGKQMKE